VSITVGGIFLLLCVLAGALWLIARQSQHEGILAPVVVGFAVRFVVTLAAYVTSLATGDGGYLYLDDRGYAVAGAQLAERWLDLAPGNLLQPLGILPHGGPLFYHLVAGVFAVSGDSVVVMELVDVVLGTATVLLAAQLAKEVLGPELTRRAAWVVGLAPTIVWWTAPMLRESLATFLATAALFAATRLASWRGRVATIALLAAVALTRSTLFAAVAAGIVAWAVARTFLGPRDMRWWRMSTVVGLVACSGALALLLASGGTGDVQQLGAVGQSISTSRDVVGGDFDSSVISGVAGGTVATYAAAALRFFTSPRAWAFTDVPLDWYQPLYPAMWLWYAVIPIALTGLWTIRRRADAMALLVLPIAVTAAEYTIALNGGVRQRSGVEPLLALLVVAGWRSTRSAALGAGAVAVILAPIVALDLESGLAAVPVLSVGLLLILIGVQPWLHRYPAKTRAPTLAPSDSPRGNRRSRK
jgi:hypothetical protein